MAQVVDGQTFGKSSLSFLEHWAGVGTWLHIMVLDQVKRSRNKGGVSRNFTWLATGPSSAAGDGSKDARAWLPGVPSAARLQRRAPGGQTSEIEPMITIAT